MHIKMTHVARAELANAVIEYLAPGLFAAVSPGHRHRDEPVSDEIRVNRAFLPIHS
jgi:hypothetical protein